VELSNVHVLLLHTSGSSSMIRRQAPQVKVGHGVL
jgi:hypothetical protein